MKIEMSRQISPHSMVEAFVIRVTEYEFADHFPSEFSEQMSEAIKHFVATNAECQILMNEMVKQAFAGVDVLAAVTEAVTAKVQASLKGIEPMRLDDFPPPPPEPPPPPPADWPKKQEPEKTPEPNKPQ